jgi:predicted transcriptional regulator
MQDESSRRTPAEQMDQMQNVVLHALLDDEVPGLWTVQEVATAVGNESEAEDALMWLHMAGLVHRHEQFVWPRRTAGRAMQLADFN